MLDQLKFGHTALADQLGRVQASVQTRGKMRNEIQLLENYLLKHISLQDKNFYNGLRQNYESERERLKIVEFLDKDLTELKVKTLTFLEEQPKNPEEFFRTVIGRIKVEQEYLFPLIKS